MGGWKQKEVRGSKIPPLAFSFVPSTFLFLSQLSVCLCVSRVRAYLTTNQHFIAADPADNDPNIALHNLRFKYIVYFICCFVRITLYTLHHAGVFILQWLRFDFGPKGFCPDTL